MVETHLSLSWEAYQQNICSGLGQLQQRGEFVDMTLAADGHHVKVHQMVMSLVSPYIKELITSAQCPHPVIFLNNISYATLSSILEYIYTGQVLVSKECLPALIAAGRALHIMGLKEMETSSNTSQLDEEKDPISEANPCHLRTSLIDKLQEMKENKKHQVKLKGEPEPVCKIFLDVDDDDDGIAHDEDFESTQIDETPSDLSIKTTTAIKSDQKINSSNGNKSIMLKNTQSSSEQRHQIKQAYIKMKA